MDQIIYSPPFASYDMGLASGTRNGVAVKERQNATVVVTSIKIWQHEAFANSAVAGVTTTQRSTGATPLQTVYCPRQQLRVSCRRPLWKLYKEGEVSTTADGRSVYVGDDFWATRSAARKLNLREESAIAMQYILLKRAKLLSRCRSLPSSNYPASKLRREHRDRLFISCYASSRYEHHRYNGDP